MVFKQLITSEEGRVSN